MATAQPQLESTLIRVHNTGSSKLPLWLEPWGELYSIDPQSSVDVRFEAEQIGMPEVDHQPDRIVVYAWPGATARVLRDGEVLEDQPLS